MKPEISIILPTKEEEGAFGVIKELKKMFGNNAEIIVVDKSGDSYFNRIRKTGVTVVRQKSKGVENGLLEGFKHAHADVLATVDADGTHELSGIKRGFKLVKEDKADLVLGNRMAETEPGAMNPYLWFGNTALSVIYDIFYLKAVRDVLTGMQIMKRECYEKVKNARKFDTQILYFQIEIAKLGYRIVEIPIKYYKRRHGESKLAKSKFLYGFGTAAQIIRRRF
jgi:dolichol-phosphate hexosyltransferase